MFKERGFFCLGLIEGFVFEDGVEALDGGNTDGACCVDDIAVEVLYVVELGEFSAVVWWGVCLKFAEGLSTEVSSVDEEESAFDFGELDESVDSVDGGVCFSTAGCHLY